MRFVTLVLIVLATVQGPLRLPSGSAFARQETAPQPPTINLEIILDSSGSMATLTDTGETRMQAAKRVLREIIGSIPEREGLINVGFRIYGHEGDNTEATKSVSCRASELLVPVEGVDRDALLAAVEGAEPAGWTPIARSILRSGGDLPPGGEGVVNAIVLVTDGAETCGGDPCKVASDLHANNTRLISHVVGFGTTPEDQQTLGCIAESGGGLLLGAANVAELRAALFSVLEELQIVVGAGFVGGNAFGLLPEGEPSALAIVAAGPFDALSGTMPFVLRNNTAEDVVGVKVSVTARDAAGNLLAAADALGVKPFFVRIGGLAFGYVYFGIDTTLPPDAAFAFDVSATPLSEARFSSIADLDIVEAALFENRIVGTAENGSEGPVDGPFGFDAACFDADGTLISVQIGFADVGTLQPGDTLSFQIDLFGLTFSGQGCPVFLVAGQGFGDPRLPASDDGAIASARDDEGSEEEDAGDEAEGDAQSTTDGFVLPGIQAAVFRNFSSDPSVTVGVLGLSAVAFVFDSADAADAGMELVRDRYFEVREENPDVILSEAQAVSAPRVGDRREALTFSINSSGIEFPAGMLNIRLGSIVYSLVIFGRDINPVNELATTATILIERLTVQDGSADAGDVFQLLPTLDDVPFGLFVSGEGVPETYGPIPSAESGEKSLLVRVPAG